MNPTAEIITIGDEILIGQTIDTNSAWIGDKLSQIGLPVRRIISISDQPEEIIAALTESLARASLVLITGGLGPTNDDRTKKTLAGFFGSKMIVNEQVLEDVEKLLSSRNIVVSQLNRDQALVPHNCRVIRNPNGTAPGMWFEHDGSVAISMPGVPYEMKAMMEQTILPALAHHFKTPPIIHKTIMTTGIAESRLAAVIKKWEENLPQGFSLAYLPSPGIVKLRITGRGQDTNAVNSRMESLVESLLPLISDWHFGFDDQPLEQVTGQLLKHYGLTVSTAESCTGGTIASLLTSIPGSSAYFRGSVVAYANDIKEKLLHVNPQSIATYGAVSREVVEKMAIEARKVFTTDYSVAVSGIAGPEGGTAEKPVGTVWIAVAGPGSVESKMFNMGEHRGRNISKSALAALNMLRVMVLRDATDTEN
jgi:nicotinamide-nucleotide amidase